MKKNKPQAQQDDAIFEALGKSRKRRRRRIILTVVIIVLVLAIAAVVTVGLLQRKVREEFASGIGEVISYEAATGTISTVVSGSGTLSNVDTESVTIPSGVEIDEVLVSVNDTVAEGDILATVNMSSVRSAMADLQAEIETLDEEISEAEDDEVSSTIEAGVSGRVKLICAEADTDVAVCMAENGALAVLSLDGYMALDLETDALTAGDSVTVTLSDGDTVTGTVESVVNGTATILVTDNGPLYGDAVTVAAEDGTELGSSTLYIHSPLAVTGYAGTVSKVYVSENKSVSDSTDLFYLTNTSYSANYDSLLRSRSEKEETLLELLAIQQNGGVAAPIAGSVYSVTDTDSTESTTELAVLSPDISMSVTITVDESDILSLEIGQTADVSVSSVSEDTLTGTVTEIDKSVSSSSGSYSAVITLDKIEGMLTGMTASVDVRIEGVDNAILIPVEALHQTSNGAYVYTTYDEETQEFGGRVDVVVGLSNNNYAEIKSGLSEGDTVYYTESETGMSMFGGMGGMGNMGGMGGSMEMPGGDFSGEMPSFGGNGGDMPTRGSNDSFGGTMPEMPSR